MQTKGSPVGGNHTTIDLLATTNRTMNVNFATPKPNADERKAVGGNHRPARYRQPVVIVTNFVYLSIVTTSSQSEIKIGDGQVRVARPLIRIFSCLLEELIGRSKI